MANNIYVVLENISIKDGKKNCKYVNWTNFLTLQSSIFNGSEHSR